MKNAFIVAYVASCGQIQITGNIDFTTDSLFLDRKRTVDIILERSAPGTHSVVITNIIRLTMEELECWRGTDHA